MKTSNIWLITGISSGIGKALAEAVIDMGDRVIGTVRQQAQADAFNQQYGSRAEALLLDVTQPEQIGWVIDYIERQYGRLDVLVNNAGFGFAGAVEEATLEEIRQVFETNFFGALQVTQAVLPIFRRQRSGRILQISSHSGFKGGPGFGIYNASKFALEGFSEALAAEVTSLGIRLTIVEPGPFRTGFASAAFREAGRIIDDYNPTAGAFRRRMKQIDGNQEGDPQKAAQAIIDLSRMDTPPLRLPLGKIAVMTIASKLQQVQQDLDDFRAVAEGVVFEG